MNDAVQTTGDLVQRAGSSILDVGVVGAVALLSILGNIALIWALVRCYRAHQVRNWEGPY